MTSVYHFTDTARLPWILQTGKLQPGANRIGGFPDPDFLWATTDARGDATASADRGEHYRSGKVRHVRFTLRQDTFVPWSDVPARFPDWTRYHVERLEAAARGRSRPDAWWCSSHSIGLPDWLEIHTRSYADNRWIPFDPETEILSFQSVDRSVWLGIGIGRILFLSRRRRGWNGAEGFEVKTISADDPAAARAVA